MAIKESDWKLLRRLKPVMLNRFCERILHECAQVIEDAEKSPHERYLDVFALVQRRDRDVAICFDEQSRSNADMKLTAMYVRGLLLDEEFRQFSEETRERVLRSNGAQD